LEKPPGFGPPGLEPARELEAGLPGLKLGLGFQPGPAFLSAREAEFGYGFALVGR
jgi:hypothetical protein